MGVDISDIDRVYHVAPSSTFVDYIQEIGRAARDKNITGVAVTDFNEDHARRFPRLQGGQRFQHLALRGDGVAEISVASAADGCMGYRFVAFQ